MIRTCYFTLRYAMYQQPRLIKLNNDPWPQLATAAAVAVTKTELLASTSK